MQLDKLNLKQLVILLSQGDAIAFEALYHQYKCKVRRFVYRFLRCNDTADELTQLVFVQLWKYKNSIDPNKDFNAFLLTITRNLVYKEFKRKAKAAACHTEMVVKEPAHDAVNSFMNLQDYQNLAAEAIASLPAQSKKVFKLSREEGASYEDISIQLNISKNTVHSHMAKSLSHIRAYFKVHTPETILTILVGLYFY